MSLLLKITDRLILQPSITPVDPGENQRVVVYADDVIEIEAFLSTHGDFDHTDSAHRLLVLKFPGTGGRAERGTVHPCELMLDAATEPTRFAAAQVWTLNHRGYGSSTGPATLENFVSTLERFWSFIEQRFPNETKLLIGNSLGCISALYLSAYKSKNVDGIMLRNPPPLARLISHRPRYNAWNFGLAKFIAAQVPPALDAIANAQLSTCPALMVSSEKDRVVPIKYQQEILGAYAGLTNPFVIEGADHDHRIGAQQEPQYRAAVQWLRERLEKSHGHAGGR